MNLLRSTQYIGVALCLLSNALGAASDDKQITIYSWTTTASSPRELAKISYNPDTSISSVSKFDPPQPKPEDGLVRVGLYDPKTSDWRGIVTGADSFQPEYQQKIELHVDDDSQVWHVGFSAAPKPKPMSGKKSKAKGAIPEIPQVVVEIVKPHMGPTPHLNKPVVLTADGKMPDKEQEKTFLQKYWWAIGLFILIQVLMSGGAEK